MLLPLAMSQLPWEILHRLSSAAPDPNTPTDLRSTSIEEAASLGARASVARLPLVSQQRLPIVLTRVAAIVLMVAPVIALVQGTVEYVGFTKVALIFVIAWGLSRSAEWARWLLVLLALFAVWGAWSAWHLPESYGQWVPAFAVWRMGRLVGALLIASAAALVFRPRLHRVESGAS
jgi:hypothetical protein